MVQWENQKLVSQRSRVRLQSVLVYLLCLLRTYKTINQNTRKQCLLFVLYCPGPLTVIYNMYTFMNY